MPEKMSMGWNGRLGLQFLKPSSRCAVGWRGSDRYSSCRMILRLNEELAKRAA